MNNLYTLDPLTNEIYPSLLGVIPPALRLGKILPKQNIPENVSGFFTDLKSFMDSFGYAGEYHNPEHFEDVHLRFNEIINYVRLKQPGAISEYDLVLAEMFAYGHDCVHNAGKPNDEKFQLSVESIVDLYGFNSTSIDFRSHVLNAMNVGIAEDSDLSGFNRDLIESISEPILQLSEEEMSAIVIDALAYRNGLSLHLRRCSHGMIQATEFRRAFSLSGELPGFKWPRTQMEVLGKLADMGNFAEELDDWLEICTKVNLEVPWFKGNSATDFIEEELFFLERMVIPLLDPKVLPVETREAHVEPIFMPEYFRSRAQEKVDYLHALKGEIEQVEPGENVSLELQNFLDNIRPALAKNDPSLANSATPIPLKSSVSQQLAK